MEWLWATLQEQMANNQFFSGGLILMLSGAGLALLRHVPAQIWQWIKNRCLIEIDIPDREPAFEWLDKWLASHSYSKERARRLTVRVESLDYRTRASDPDADHRPRILMSPAPGEHWLWYRGRLVILNRQRADPEKNNQGQALAVRETFGITIVSRQRELAWQLLEEARNFVLPPSERRLTIYHVAYACWGEQTKRLPRSPDSVILRAGLMEDLVADARRFLESREWYLERGIPYRRGYLLHGPPGTGKSSAVVGLASALGMDIAMLSLNSLTLDDSELADRLAEVPPNALVLFEDIDCAFVARKATEEKTGRITFSGLLNAIDGVAAGEGRLLFATTNHPERLDPALIRPGRIDRKVEIGLADSDQLARIFRRFFPTASDALVAQFVSRVPVGQIAMSAIQTYLIQNADSAEAAVERTAELQPASNRSPPSEPSEPAEAESPAADAVTTAPLWFSIPAPHEWKGAGI